MGKKRRVSEQHLIFNAPAHHLLIEQGERIRGGQRFTVTEDRALELLTNPHLNIIEAPEPADAGEEPETDPGTDQAGEQASGALQGGGHQNDPKEDL